MNINKYKKYNFQNIKNGKQSYCQISGKKNLIDVIDLGNQPLADSLIQKKDLNKDTSISCINVNTGSSRQYILENKNEIIYEGNYSWDFSENPFYITKEWNRQRIWVSFRDRVDTKIFEDIEIEMESIVIEMKKDQKHMLSSVATISN